MKSKKVYPEWFLAELADEETRHRFEKGDCKVSECVYFTCPNGHPAYKQLVKNHITSSGTPRNKCPVCAKLNQTTFVPPDWVVEDLANETEREALRGTACNSKSKFSFVCKQCGTVYEQTIWNHSIGKRVCHACASKCRGKSYSETIGQRRKPYPEWFVNELVNDSDKERALRGDITGTENVTFRCLAGLEHPNYVQTVKSHICISTGHPKNGCPVCRYIKSSKGISEFYKGVRKEFPPELYDEVYKDEDRDKLRNRQLSYNESIDWVCQSCGRVYSQMIKDHIRGKRCNYCAGKISDEECILREMITPYYNGEILYNTRDGFDGYEVDIYIPEYKIAIEYNGSFWHKSLPSGFASRDRLYHLHKFELCQRKGIRLLSIFDVDLLFRKEILSRFFMDLFVPKKVLYARKCRVECISSSMANSMYAQHHLLGSTPNLSVSYGLFHEGELVSCMSFQKGRYKVSGHPVWCLTRFVTKSGISVIGGASKLLCQFEQAYSPSSIVSYSDNDFFQGGVYEKLGFTCLGVTKTPRYYWFLHGLEYSREQCQLKNLSKNYPDLFEEAKSIHGNKEDFIMLRLGAFKVFRSGHTKWVKHYEGEIYEKG